MDKKLHRAGPVSVPSQTLLCVIAAWLLASAVLNWLSRAVPAYFSVRYAGLGGLPLLLIAWAASAAIFFLIVRRANQASRYHNTAGRLLFLSWLIFSFSVLLRLGGTLSSATLLILNMTSLILARSMFVSALKKRRPADILLSLGGAALVIYNLWRTPWAALGRELFIDLGIPAEAVLPLFLAYFGLIIILSVVFSRSSALFNKPAVSFLVLFCAMFLQMFLSGRILYARYETLSTPTYDFNLFAQMFHNMAETLQPVTTLERNMPLSHFKVHLSPVYYLLLPFYLIIRTPAILNILQAVIVALGIIPLDKIARRFDLPGKVRIAFSLVYLFSVPLITSGFYDLHENSFLPLFLLWLIYFIETKSNLGMAVFTLLTLSVKEDAALYIWALAAFIIFDRRMIRQGLAMFFASSVYFVWALNYLQNHGDGAMTDRFASLIAIREWSILAVPYAVIRNPGFILSKISAPGKLTYLVQMLAPLGFTPLFSRKLSRWILLIPFVLMNLMVDYPYQYDIRFQYNYGSYTLLLYLALLFFRDLTEADKTPGLPRAFGSSAGSLIGRGLLVLAMASGILISAFHLMDYERYPRQMKTNRDMLIAMKQVMDEIPADRSVLASDFLTGYLSQREKLYDISYNYDSGSYFPADYIVIDLRPGYGKEHQEKVPVFLADGYTIKVQREGQILLLERSIVP